MIEIWGVIGELVAAHLEMHSMIESAVLFVFGRPVAAVGAPLDIWLLQVY